jgi:hypothetical protein
LHIEEEEEDDDDDDANTIQIDGLKRQIYVKFKTDKMFSISALRQRRKCTGQYCLGRVRDPHIANCQSSTRINE